MPDTITPGDFIVNGSVDAGAAIAVDSPSSETDFSVLPGGVAPATGSYIAIDTNIIWTIKGGETEWKTSSRITE